ncbi:hypothetical protein DL766_007818 [Monosporascus sp. MC13-8B]|uniref:Uncharacterized protein n=1 Tax=Monosporascus cannonballus TaxID=155416 RepID=A0ABY0GZ21_9PEZI|nr:hypothetical protein DL762_007659 [Monosporascus cannonballus]RYO98557.1 hypothetical protein DL763_002087 [Monosporascus cannonballus]RYP21969.1 hypothetical protein DL766_007818 [Monosporascus sp. MC13-8B]
MADEALSPQSLLAAQWTEPGDIFSVLLILGGDVIQLACAAMAGGPGLLPTPVAFSFGWVAYAMSAVLSAIGENRLLRCAPEVDVKVTNLATGYGRSNRSWLLSRFVKTYPFWMPKGVRTRIKAFSPPPAKPSYAQKRPGVGILPVSAEGGAAALASAAATQDHVALCVAVYQWKSDPRPGHPVRDWVWWSGYVASAVQLGVAAVPFGLHRDWTIFMATAIGTALAYASASLPQWRREKWHSREARNKPVALTLGNGSEHVIIIEGSEAGYDLEALAGGPRTWHSAHTVLWTSLLAVLWLALLVSCTGIKANTWYLLAVGGLGMLQNIVVAAAPRTPEAIGLPIQLVTHSEGPDSPGEVFAEPKVMWALMELESRHPRFGKFLKDDFFPGELRPWEKKWWDSEDRDERARLLAAARQKRQKEREDKTRGAASAV